MEQPLQSGQAVQTATIPADSTNGHAQRNSPRVLLLETSGETLSFLTENSVNHIQTRISDFAKQVLQEARAIERTEHVGKGSPEITAAHIDEAWWVSRRRIRRPRHPVLMGLCRIGEGFGTLAVSVGFTNLTHTWGLVVFGLSVIVTATAYVIEMQLGRSD